MSSKTKIVVLHLKELIYTVIFIVLGLLLILLLLFMFLPDKSESENASTATAEATATTAYIPGVYTSSVSLNGNSVDVQVTVDSDHINSISLVNLDETTQAMYPLVEPALDSLSEQILANNSTVDITYPEEYQYTSTVLMEAIENALAKAEVD